MTKKTLAAVVISFLLTGAVTSIYAVDISLPGEGMVQIIETTDGSTLVGMITDINDNAVTVETELGTLIIYLDMIESIRQVPVESIRRDQTWFPNPSDTRLFVSPTGRPLDKGGLNIVGYYLFVPMISYGITRNFSVSGGMSLIPTAGLENQIIYLMPRFGFNLSRDLSISLGAFGVKQFYMYDESILPDLGFLFTSVTFGKPDLSVTGGIAYGILDYELMAAPAVMLGGEFRVAKGISLVTENYLIPDYGDLEPILSFGARFMGESLSIDAGFFLPVDNLNEFFPGFPFLAVAYNF